MLPNYTWNFLVQWELTPDLPISEIHYKFTLNPFKINWRTWQTSNQLAKVKLCCNQNMRLTFIKVSSESKGNHCWFKFYIFCLYHIFLVIYWCSCLYKALPILHPTSNFFNRVDFCQGIILFITRYSTHVSTCSVLYVIMLNNMHFYLTENTWFSFWWYRYRQRIYYSIFISSNSFLKMSWSIVIILLRDIKTFSFSFSFDYGFDRLIGLS